MNPPISRHDAHSNRKPSAPPPKPPNSRGNYAKLAIIAASATFVSARLVDIALISTGVAAAAGSALFAGVMVMRGDHNPPINGQEYLSVFAAPKGSVSPSADSTEVADTPGAQPGIDLSPLGAINLPSTIDRGDYTLVSARSDLAWVRAGSNIFAVHPGDTLPNLGKVSAIIWGGGHWTVVSDRGEILLVSGDGGETANPKSSFVRPLIIDGAGN